MYYVSPPTVEKVVLIEAVKVDETLEKVCVDVVEAGRMTKDLAILIRPDHPFLTTDEFMSAIAAELKRRMH